MELSYNGWSASTSAHDFGGLDNRAVAGVRMAPGVRAGAVATVLFYVAEQFHNRVEPLVAGWCWGYSYRQNRNAANLSCHSSATAIDLNAPRHPNGKRGTFTAAQVAEIRRILTEVGKVVRWGGDFTGTADEMHFEIVASPATVAMVAGRLNPKGPAGSPVTTLPAPPVQEDDMFGPEDAARLASIAQWLDPNNGELTDRVRGLTFPKPGSPVGPDATERSHYVPVDSGRLVGLYEKFVQGGQVTAADIARAMLPELINEVRTALEAKGGTADPAAIATAVLDGLAARVAA